MESGLSSENVKYGIRCSGVDSDWYLPCPLEDWGNPRRAKNLETRCPGIHISGKRIRSAKKRNRSKGSLQGSAVCLYLGGYEMPTWILVTAFFCPWMCASARYWGKWGLFASFFVVKLHERSSS